MHLSAVRFWVSVSDSMSFNEFIVEDAALTWFGELRYTLLPQPLSGAVQPPIELQAP